jgi:polyphosphate kinase 2
LAKDGTMKDPFEDAAIELVKIQRDVIESKRKVLIIFEGRDAAGKDGTIKRLTKHMSPRDTRIVALGKPGEKEARAWYFERYVAQLPLSGEIVLFNRSWYNRAGVEIVMKFCTPAEYEDFMMMTPAFENMLAHCGFTIIKYYLDITKKEQKRRLTERSEDPLKQWKLSPIDAVAQQLWAEYSDARNEMLKRTSIPDAPWTIVKADNKNAARLAVMRDVIRRLSTESSGTHYPPPDEDVLFSFSPNALEDGLIAK